LRESARKLLKASPIYLDGAKAEIIIAQFQETAKYRTWEMHALAIMNNHFHIVVTADEEIQSADILGDFKSYASRILNRRYGKPASGTWWTESGSRRPLPHQKALEEAVDYVQYRNPIRSW